MLPKRFFRAKSYDREVQDLVLRSTLARMSEDDTERLAGCLLDHPEAHRPGSLLVPADERAEATAYLVQFSIFLTLVLRDDFGESESEKLRDWWRRTATHETDRLVADVRLLWSEGRVHDPRLYAIWPDESAHA